MVHSCFMVGNPGDNKSTLEESLDLALKLNDDPEIVSHVIQLLVKLDKIKDAKKVYKKYIKLKPEDKKLIELKKILNEI